MLFYINLKIATREEVLTHLFIRRNLCGQTWNAAATVPTSLQAKELDMELDLQGEFTEQNAREFMRKCKLNPEEWSLEAMHFGPHGGRWSATHNTIPNLRGSFFWYGSDTYGYHTEQPLR